VNVYLDSTNHLRSVTEHSSMELNTIANSVRCHLKVYNFGTRCAGLDLSLQSLLQWRNTIRTADPAEL
jgi:hypothetical protein